MMITIKFVPYSLSSKISHHRDNHKDILLNTLEMPSLTSLYYNQGITIGVFTC